MLFPRGLLHPPHSNVGDVSGNYERISTEFLQVDVLRRNLVQLRSFDRFDVCILKN